MAQLKEIFDISYGTKFDYNKMITKSDGIAFVSRKATNNGIAGFVDYYMDVEPIEAGNITVALGGNVLSSFVQLHNFYTAQNVAVLRPLDNDMSLNEKIYYCECIEANKHKYSAFGREANSTLEFLEVPNRKDVPQWVHDKDMPLIDSIPDYFLEEGYDRACWYLDNINQTEFENKYKKSSSDELVNFKSIDTWKPFKLGQLFEVYTGEDLIISSLDEGKYNVVSHSKKNNGVSATTQELENRKLFDCMSTISLADRGNFYATIQDSDFYIGTRVKALEAKFKDCNKYKLMFICVIINQEEFRFSYGRNCCDRLSELIIKLPILYDKNGKILYDENGNFIPDFGYMEKYIKSLNFSKTIEESNLAEHNKDICFNNSHDEYDLKEIALQEV